MWKVVAAAVLFVAPGQASAFAQEHAAQTSWAVVVSPALALDRSGFEEVELSDVLDQSELGLIATFEQTWEHGWGATVEAEATMTPGLVSGVDRESALNIDFAASRTVGRHRFRLTNSFGQKYDGLLGARSRFDRTLTPSYRFRSSFGAGVTLAVSVGWRFAYSSDGDRSYAGPTLDVEASRDRIWSMPFGGSVRFSNQWRRYDSRLADDLAGGASSDRMRVQANLLLSDTLHAVIPRTRDVELDLAVRWTHTRSNVDDLRGDEWAVIPTFKRTW
jgi:hypothetical protein